MGDSSQVLAKAADYDELAAPAVPVKAFGPNAELAFPPASYMHKKFPRAAVKWLPVLYVQRGLTGISRLIVPRDPGGTH